jgi:hypothetical protein
MEQISSDTELVQLALQAQAQEQAKWRAFSAASSADAAVESSSNSSTSSAAAPSSHAKQLKKRAHSSGRVVWVNMSESDALAVWAQQTLQSLHSAQQLSPRAEAAALLSQNSTFTGKRALLAEILGSAQRHSTTAAAAAHGDAAVVSSESCLTEVWTCSSGRFGWVDLQAGPFEWGSCSRQTGRKTRTTLPRVPVAATSAGSNSATVNATAAAAAEDAAGDAAAAAGAAIGADEHTALELKRLDKILTQKQAQLIAQTAYLQCEAIVGSRGEDNFTHQRSGMFFTVDADAEVKQCMSLLLQQVLIESFSLGAATLEAAVAEAHADSAKLTDSERLQLAEGIDKAQQRELQLYQLLRAVVAPPLHFGAAAAIDVTDTIGATTLTAATTAGAGAQVASPAAHLFLTHLAVVLQSLGRHVVTPMSALPTPVADLYDISAYSSQQRRFRRSNSSSIQRAVERAADHTWATLASEVYVPQQLLIDVTLVRAQSSYAAADVTTGGIDLVRLQQELLALTLPGDLQQTRLTLHSVALSDAPAALKTALTAARKRDTSAAAAAAAVAERSVLDSAVLHGQTAAELEESEFLEPWADDRNATARALAQPQRIAILIYSVDEQQPLYVDTQGCMAAAVGGDLVIAVQNSQRTAATDFCCGTAAATASPRNPVQAVLAAAAQLIAGLLPAHMSAAATGTTDDYGAARLPPGDHQYSVTEDWLWAASSSSSSSEQRYGVLQADIAQRNHIARGVAATHQLLHSAVSMLLLTQQSTTDVIRGYSDAAKQCVAALSDSETLIHIRTARGLRDDLIALTGRTQLSAALALVNSMLDSAVAAQRSAATLRDLLYHCDDRKAGVTEMELLDMLVLLLLFAALVAVVAAPCALCYCCFRRYRPRAAVRTKKQLKIN